jgi:hypothetical protein
MGRKSENAVRRAARDASLKGMFRALSLRPVPDHLLETVDQLDPPATPRKRARG